MKTIDFKHSKTAGKYALALFQTAAEAGIEDKIYDELVFVSETINTNEDLKNVLITPLAANEDKKGIIEKLFKPRISKITLDFVYILIDSSRLDCLNEAAARYIKENNRKKNIITPVIISAVKLNEIQKQRIIQKLEERTKKTIYPDYEENPDIIGGLIIKIDNKTIDCSIKGKFDSIKRHLTGGNSYGGN